MNRVFLARGWALVAALSVTEASAQEPATLCEFVQKVLAAKPLEFAPFKGEPQNRAVFGDTVFKGTFLPPSGTGCVLHTRTKVGRANLPPIYNCTLASISDFGEANRLFAKAATDLRACLPNAEFVVKYDGEAKTPREMFSWIVSAEGNGYTLELQMSNTLALISEGFGGPPADMPEIAVTVDITDTSEPSAPI